MGERQQTQAHALGITELWMRNKLLDRTFLVFAVFACLSYVAIRVRTTDIGWHTRDTVQTLLLVLIILGAVFRRRLPDSLKIAFLISVFTIIGFLGVATLGLMAGGVLCLPIAAVISALSHSRRVFFFFSIACCLLLCLVGFGYTAGHLSPSTSPTVLMENLPHWVMYALCLAYFCAVAGTVILGYRGAVTELVKETEAQKRELSESNLALQKALAEIKTLRGVLPTCQHCKKVRPADQPKTSGMAWIPIESYIRDHSEADFSHGICPECMRELYGEELMQEVYSED